MKKVIDFSYGKHSITKKDIECVINVLKSKLSTSQEIPRFSLKRDCISLSVVVATAAATGAGPISTQIRGIEVKKPPLVTNPGQTRGGGGGL